MPHLKGYVQKEHGFTISIWAGRLGLDKAMNALFMVRKQSGGKVCISLHNIHSTISPRQQECVVTEIIPGVLRFLVKPDISLCRL